MTVGHHTRTIERTLPDKGKAGAKELFHDTSSKSRLNSLEIEKSLLEKTTS